MPIDPDKLQPGDKVWSIVPIGSEDIDHLDFESTRPYPAVVEIVRRHRKDSVLGSDNLFFKVSNAHQDGSLTWDWIGRYLAVRALAETEEEAWDLHEAATRKHKEKLLEDIYWIDQELEHIEKRKAKP
jgi:hypothetical protein